MKIIVLRNAGSARHLAFNTNPVLAVGLGVFAILILGFAGGFKFAGGQTNGPALAELAAARAELESQRLKVIDLEDRATENLDAMALRVGELNASVIRLNALGRRLTDMADLDDGEFDFNQPPALGGPRSPAYASDVGRAADLMSSIASLDDNLLAQAEQLDVLEGLMLNRKLRERVYPRGRPVKSGYLSSAFGKRIDPFTGETAYHRGVDFAGKRGTEIISVAAGVVVWSGDRFGFGKMVEINHGNGYVTRYAHNQENLVAVGDRVKSGQTIALLGSSGRATGPNLHFEVLHLGRPVDPRKHIQHSL